MKSTPENPFPHPENRMWHPMATSFSQLLLLVVSSHPDQLVNQWKDDVIYFLLWWEKTHVDPHQKKTGKDSISLKHLIDGLRSLADTLEKKNNRINNLDNTEVCLRCNQHIRHPDHILDGITPTHSFQPKK